MCEQKDDCDSATLCVNRKMIVTKPLICEQKDDCDSATLFMNRNMIVTKPRCVWTKRWLWQRHAICEQNDVCGNATFYVSGRMCLDVAVYVSQENHMKKEDAGDIGLLQEPL